MLLASMSDHEGVLAKALADFVQGAPAGVLQTWCTSSHDSSSLLDEMNVEVGPQASVDDVVQAAIELDDRVIEVFEELAGRAEPEEVHVFF